jgi:protein-tyrosine phosphatase
MGSDPGFYAGFYDLHCHLLPGIDDGPATLDEALAMARLAVAAGIRRSIVTPHLHVGRWDNDLARIESAVGAYRRALEDAGIALEVGFAAEVRLDYDVLPMIDEGRVPFLGALDGAKVMLLELPHSHVPVGADKFVAWLLDRGIRPMIAHPERNKDIVRDGMKLKPFVDAGCLVQLTADAIAGGFGAACRERALDFLRRGWVNVVASDAHDTVARPPRLAPALLDAERALGARAARALVEDLPRRIVEGG